MKAKILSIVLLAAAASATAAFASGQGDKPAPGNRGWAPPQISDQTITVSGTLSLKDTWHPLLKSGQGDYFLMVPRPYLYEVTVKDGDPVKVEGYVMNRAPWQASDDQTKGMIVTKATVNGKDYTVPRGPMAGGRWGGRGPGMMGGRPGRGPGMMGGNWGPGPGPGYAPGPGPGPGPRWQ